MNINNNENSEKYKIINHNLLLNEQTLFASACPSNGTNPVSRAKPVLNDQSRIQISGNRFANKYVEFRKKQFESPSDLYLDLNKVLYDEKMTFALENDNVSEVSKDYWQLMINTKQQFEIEIKELNKELTKLWGKHLLAKYLGIGSINEIEAKQNSINQRVNLLTSNKKLWCDFATCVDKLLSSAEGKSNPDFMKTRVFNIYQQIINASEKDKRRLLDIISEYSTACNDRALVGLERAEIVAPLIRIGDDLLLNVLILEFKRHLIQIELVPTNSRESVETYLFYSIYFNEILMLKNKNKSMDYASIASKHSFDEAINAVLKRMTVEDLVGFISGHEMFQEAYQKEYTQIVDGLMGEIADMAFDDPNIMTINNKYKHVVDCFYQEKARELLCEKGFITANVNYNDPNSFSEANIPEPRQLSDRLMHASALNRILILYFVDRLYAILQTLTVLCMPENYSSRIVPRLYGLSFLLIISVNFFININFLAPLSLLTFSLVWWPFIPTNWIIRSR